MDIKKFMKDIPLENRLKVALEMDDYDNWDDGHYKGNRARLVPIIMDVINKFNKDKTA